MIKYLIDISKGFRWRIFGIIFLGWIRVILMLVFVWISKAAIDIATGKIEGDLFYQSVLLILIASLQISLQLIYGKTLAITYTKLINHVRSQFFSEIMRVRWENLQSVHSGDFLTRSLNDSNDVVSLLLNAIPSGSSSLLQFVGAFAMLYYFDPVLAMIIVGLTPILLLLSKAYFRKMRFLTKEIKESESTISKFLQESYQGQLVIRAFEQQIDKINDLDEIQFSYEQRVRNKTSFSTFTNGILLVTFRGGFLAAFIRGLYLLNAGSITFGTLTAYLQLVGRLQAPMNNMMGVLSSVVSASTSVERLGYIRKLEHEELAHGIKLEAPITLSMNNVSFAYSGEECDVFHDFSMEVLPGEMVGIVGESGAGKSTLMRLLLGLVKPNQGEIFLSNGIDRIVVSEKTRPNFVYVPQGESLFSVSIRENLLLADPSADDNRLAEVLEMASAQFVLNELQNGLDTILGERGAKLSEGQSQRVAIARSLLREGDIILLDEPTSALDSETAKEFLENLKMLMKNKSIIIITHQHEVAAYCDKIIPIMNLSRL